MTVVVVIFLPLVLAYQAWSLLRVPAARQPVRIRAAATARHAPARRAGENRIMNRPGRRAGRAAGRASKA